MADPDLHMRGVGLGFGSGQPDLEISGGPGLNFFFRPFGPQFALKIRRRGQAPLQDPPLQSSRGKSLAPNP